GQPVAPKSQPIQLSEAMSGNTSENLSLRDGDVLTIRQNPGWNDIGASISLKGEFQHPGAYGIKPGERLSSVLQRAGGFSPLAYPYGAVLMRREVRELQLKSHAELVRRLRTEQQGLRALPESDADQKNVKLTALAESETALRQLEANPPVGRMVIHIQQDLKDWRGTAKDVIVRDGDELFVPKRSGYVLVNGQVFNPTAVAYQPGRSAKWYLSQSGGLTALAEKKAVFVVRADGSVIAARNVSGDWFSGDPMNATLRPGAMVVFPENPPKVRRNWTNTFQIAQIATSVALAVAYIHP